MCYNMLEMKQGMIPDDKMKSELKSCIDWAEEMGL